MRWWIGEVEATDGYVHKADNGNEYTLTMDDEGMWNPPEFKPMMMDIAGTVFKVQTREDRIGYDVVMMGEDGTYVFQGDTSLPESGMGEFTSNAGAMYRVRMVDGAFAGNRIDSAIVEDTEYAIGAISDADDGAVDADEDVVGLQLLGDNAETENVDESGTALQLSFSTSADEDTIKDGLESHMFSDLLGRNSSENNGKNIVQAAAEEIQAQRDRLAALAKVLTEDDDAPTLTAQINSVETDVQTELRTIFGGDYELNLDSEVEEALEDIDSILMALSSLTGFEEATAEDGGGFFEDEALSASKAEEVFDATTSQSMVAFGSTADTRYGAGMRKDRGTAEASLGDAAIGAFAYATINETLRLAHVQSTGTARYLGGTRAVDDDSNLYAGDIKLEVRFAQKAVAGLISNLKNLETDMPWQYRYGDVSGIILPDATFSGSSARWNTSGMANVTFAEEVGSPLPQEIDGSMFAGRLLGEGDMAGTQAVGVWSLGSVLYGGFGAERGDDTPEDPLDTDDGGVVETTSVVPNAAQDDFNITLKDGTLTLGTAIEDDTDTNDVVETRAAATSVKWELDLATEIGREGAERTENGDKWVDDAAAEITKIRDKLESLQDIGGDQIGGDTNRAGAEDAAWDSMLTQLDDNIFGLGDDNDTNDVVESPEAVGVIDDPYGTDGLGTAERSSRDDAERISIIDQVITALSSESALASALDGGVFDGFEARASAADLFARRKSKLKIWMGSTDFTRFGAWREQTFASAEAGAVNAPPGQHNVFAYSALDATDYAATEDPAYPGHGGVSTARYAGQTVALQGNNFYAGDVEATVAWSATTVEATLTLVVMNLENANGDLLGFGSDDNQTDVGEFIFSSNTANVTRSDEMISVDTNATWTLAYELATAGRPRETGASGSDVEGLFVGFTREGPLGLIGRWSIPSTSGGQQVGGGQRIDGAFGAELTP
jgi:hypothetical protein